MVVMAAGFVLEGNLQLAPRPRQDSKHEHESDATSIARCEIRLQRKFTIARKSRILGTFRGSIYAKSI